MSKNEQLLEEFIAALPPWAWDSLEDRERLEIIRQRVLARMIPQEDDLEFLRNG